MREFDTDTLRIIAAFENITGTEVRDCIRNDYIFFLVNEGKIAMAIGKNGQMIKTAERMLGKPIKVFEWAADPKAFIKNLIPQAQKIEIGKDGASVSLNSKDRGTVIGKGGYHINIIREFLERNSDIKSLRVV